jgi:hypothetical protein
MGKKSPKIIFKAGIFQSDPFSKVLLNFPHFWDVL